MRFRGWLLILFWGYTFPSFAQDTDPEIAERLEWLQQNPDDNLDYSELAERLLYFKKHPLNLNKAGSEEWNELSLLSPLQITELLAHIKENGPFLDLYELQSLNAFTLEDVRRILPFVTIGTVNPFKDVGWNEMLQARHDLMFRFQQQLQQQKGFTINDTSASRYLGSPQQLLLRYRYQLNRHLSAALNLENDAGEQLFRSASTGFDFISGHIALKDIGHVKKIVIGDYDLQFGQGLALWSGLSFGKSPQIQTIAKQEVGLKPYSSLNEGLYFRGIATAISFKSWLLTPFYSYRKLDASLTETGEITSLNMGGYHRTLTELDHRHKVGQEVYGTNLQWRHKALQLGLNYYQTAFSRKFDTGQFSYNQFEFSGEQLKNSSLYYNYTFKNTYFFGEAAKASGSNLALLSGLISSLSPKFSLGLLYRNLPYNYTSFYNGALSEASTAVNEKALYVGFQLKPNAKWEWSSYIDAFQFPWLKYGIDAPSVGHEVLSQLIYKPNKRFQIIALWRLERKQQNDDLDNTINAIETVQHTRFRLDLQYGVYRNWTFRNRFEMVQFQADKAYLLFQDVLYKPLQSRLSGNVRFAVFDVPTYDSRIYAFQNDVLYSYSIVAYQYQGYQFYINLRYRLLKGLDTWLHYESQHYLNKENIGSGLSEIAGNRRSEIKLQVRYQF